MHVYNNHILSVWVSSELPHSQWTLTTTSFVFSQFLANGQIAHVFHVYPRLIKSLILHPQFSHSRCPFGSEAENSVWKQCWLLWKNNCLHIGYPGGKGFVMFWEKDKEEVGRGGNANQQPPLCFHLWMWDLFPPTRRKSINWCYF